MYESGTNDVKNPGLIFFFFLCFLIVSRPLLSRQLLSGLDVLDAERCQRLKGKRVALITNAAGVSSTGEDGYKVFLRHGLDLKYLMAPEHGFRAVVKAGDSVEDETLAGDLKVYSLYGAARKPDVQLLKNTVDVLVFDLQDVGVRCYTYISTMRYAMEACQEAGVSFMVLDRMNPLAPLPAEGFMLDPEKSSFVGMVPVPFIHSMTVGEIACFLKKRYYQELDLKVVAMNGYDSRRFADEYSSAQFISPSPNIRDLQTVLVYPATVFLEATNVSEGRGTLLPFRQFGAPFINAGFLKDELDAHRLPGVSFKEVQFTPSSSKFAGLQCGGVQLNVTDRMVFEPFRTGVAIMLTLKKLYPELFDLHSRGDFLDKLAGTSLFRRMVESDLTLEEILAASRLQVHAFEQANPDRFLYK
ncbi:MAG: DUF1343 domain-containing protein [Chlorobium phaeobacteroides]|uniref:DUF1343 domain-containing protein n=1 Tax=Chlorobium phaeobacteroides (strain BS1) TaxID=331678 RepID=B3EQL9_CHLPB|nr:DUF1343 domain-containing protein [Chlorobium phaeobacteroides]MBL6956424.1 DUF1343 domain-containing protein [Chlorobium phaeobacteroides]